MRPAMILFAKAPVAGTVKTRLQPLLTAAQAAELHCSFVTDMLGLLDGFRIAPISNCTQTVSRMLGQTSQLHARCKFQGI
jgi:glycosyltransferase A (GT-A) superfamily protein (DUF2064 family)